MGILGTLIILALGTQSLLDPLNGQGKLAEAVAECFNENQTHTDFTVIFNGTGVFLKIVLLIG